MTVRIFDPGTGAQQPIAIFYRVPRLEGPGEPDLDRAIRDALPGVMLVAYDDAQGEPLATSLDRARNAGWRDGPIALVGWSKGVIEGVRVRLLEGVQPAAVLVFDGTYAAWNTMDWQVNVWRERFDAARAGRGLFVASHTFETYVELPAARPRHLSSVSVLRKVTGWPLDRGGDLPLGAARHEGAAHVHSYTSLAQDDAAHRAQLTTVMPALLREHLAPWFSQLIDNTPKSGTEVTLQMRAQRQPIQCATVLAANYTKAKRARCDLVVLHTTEGASRSGAARNVAHWFRFGAPNHVPPSPPPKASAHYVVDGDDVVRCVNECDVAWGAKHANRTGLQIELCGRAKQTREEWLAGPVLPRAAALVAELCERHQIPIVYLNEADLRARRRGITGHVDVNRAFEDGKGHWDPGPHFPWDNFLEMVRKA